MAFSGALQLTDLDDFLAPSQACILPVKQKNKVTDQAQGVNPEVSPSDRHANVCSLLIANRLSAFIEITDGHPY
jgi:hypothetical protein